MNDPVFERPDDRPCDSCRWMDDGECTLRGSPRVRYPVRSRKGRLRILDADGESMSETRMPLPEDLGASCPPALWTSREEVWYDHPTLVRSVITKCAEEESLENSKHGERRLGEQIGKAFKRICREVRAKRRREGRSCTKRNILPYRED